MFRNSPNATVRKTVAFLVTILIVGAFTSGAGIASIFQNLNRESAEFLSLPLGEHILAIDQRDKTLIKTEKILPPMLRVEIIRDGETICESIERPTINTSKTFTEYSLNRPIAGCPNVEKGDIVKAVWTFHNEVEVSAR